MKKGLTLQLLIAITTFATSAQADILMQTHMENGCAGVVGTWSGTGHISNWSIGKCEYHGMGQVTSLDPEGHFALNVEVDKDSGSALCPKHSAAHLSGSCRDGVLILKTDYGSLNGTASGNTATAKGTLTLPLGMKADALINLKKVSFH